MKRLLIIILVFILFFAGFQKTSAQDASSSGKIIQIQYELPYPGILPDNPLYFLKAIRDNVLGFFITDPLKKADYSLLMADKRLQSAKALLDKGNNDLAITTLSKSGNYFHQAIQNVANAKRRGEFADPLIDRLLVASMKHREIILQMEQKAKGQTKYNLELLRERTEEFQNSVSLIKAQ